MQRLIKGIKYNLKAKASKFRKYNAVGLNYFKIKYLKHALGHSIKSHKMLGLTWQYISGPDFLHSLIEIFVDGVYKSDMQPAPFIIDCGSNIGLSILYFHKFYPAATIIGYEPDDINFGLLTNNLKQLHSDNISVNKEAIWIHNEYISFENGGGLGSKISAGGEVKNSTKIKSTRLYDLLVRKVDFLKMDIEGAEFAVIKDIKDRLHWVDNFFIEYHGKFENQNELLELFDIIKEAGFLFYIKEALNIFPHPFSRNVNPNPYESQLNIFCFRANHELN